MVGHDDWRTAPIHVVHLLPHLEVGGGPTHVLGHLSVMDPERFSHTMVAVGPPYTLAHRFERAGIEVVGLDHRRHRRLPRSIARLVRLLRRRRADVLHTNTRTDRLIGHPAALVARVPVVDTLRSEHSAAFYSDRPSDPRRLWLERHLYGLAVDRTIAISHTLAQRWLDARPSSAAPIPVETIYPGIDIRAFDERAGGPPETADDVTGDADGPVLIEVAALREGKGHREAIQAMPSVLQEHPDAVLLLAGDGPLRGALEDLRSEVGVDHNVSFLGRRDDVPRLLAAADVFVMPSRSEGFGNAAIEAATAGLPVVVSRIGPIQEWLTDGESGVFCEVGDAPSVARAVLAVLDDPDGAAEMGAHNRANVEEHMDVRVWARRLAAVYADVVHHGD